MKRFYVTTPIYYPSGKLHLGHVYSTVAADVIARYKKQQGYETVFLTGMDEHGEKIEKKALEANISPIEFVNEKQEEIIKLWNILDVNYNIFSRTTDEFHVKQVQKYFSQLLENDDIYLSEYEGKYCVSCETFVTETNAKHDKCPDCGTELTLVKEECYKFRCSKYIDEIKRILENDVIEIKPESRKKEIINSFINNGVPDLALTRTNFTWGIPVLENPNHVMYVWFDALCNYITMLEKHEMMDFWPANIQIMGKEIIRFHVIYWPMFLLALNKPLPKKMFAHGWLLMNGEKMSKSKKNVIYPDFLVDRYGSDAVRYFLLREIPFGKDGIFTPENFVNRYNADLVNEFGNLINRTQKMITNSFPNKVMQYELTIEDENLFEKLNAIESKHDELINNLEYNKDLENTWFLVQECNKYIDLTEPWVLAKEDKKERLSTILFNLMYCIMKINDLIEPYMPNTNAILNESIVFEDEVIKITKQIPILFNRLDKKEIDLIEENMQ